ncbi:MAG: type II toxin-antitoxin system RelB/DinJ family antitoxin [Lachnospiraceae bacterium]|nr:type II toxin-antitoxin system RelB/DinJ family antitoxin [Lachnospiraceae bacterium]
MANTTVTFRTEEDLKQKATELFESLGMNLSVAINMFLRQAVEKQQYPCSLELNITKNFEGTYPAGFFDLFGSGADLGLDEEPEDLPIEANEKGIVL